MRMTSEQMRNEIAASLPLPVGIRIYDTLPSTNTYARALAEAGETGPLVVIARTQTAGRGRYDRRFESPEDCGIYLSYLLHPDCRADEVPMLTTCTAVAVAEAIESLTDVKVQIKWVNDLWVSGKKISGILTEGAFSPDGGVRYAVVGVGINVKRAVMPPEVADIATSLENVTSKIPSISLLTARVIEKMTAHFACFTNRAYLESYRARSALDGCRVTVSRGEEIYEAMVRGVGESGELLLTMDDGEERVLVSGEVVSIKRTKQ